MKIRAIANDQEGYVMFAYGKNRDAAKAQLIAQLAPAWDDGKRGAERWLKANRGFLTFEEVPDDTDEGDAG